MLRILPGRYIKKKVFVAWKRVIVGSKASQNALEKRKISLFVLIIEPQFVVISARSLIIYHLRYTGSTDGIELAN